MYPPEMVAPMVAELTNEGFESLQTADAVNTQLDKAEGTTLLVINSVCGCAAAGARPGVRLAVANAAKRPDRLVTVFAGVDGDAVRQAREFLMPYPPSSPAVALFKDGKLVHFLERHHIEGRSAAMISDNLKMAMEHYC
jgi:putative YphP/YqiW family bacilliredoxin